jgi:hypothetical protein
VVVYNGRADGLQDDDEARDKVSKHAGWLHKDAEVVLTLPGSWPAFWRPTREAAGRREPPKCADVQSTPEAGRVPRR